MVKFHEDSISFSRDKPNCGKMTYLAMLNNPSKIRRSADDFQNVIGSVLSKDNGKISMKIESIVFT